MENQVINRIQVDKIYSNEEVDLKSVFHYRMEKELKMAHGENPGEYAEAYCKIEIKHGNPIDYDRWHQVLQKYDIAREYSLDPNYITPITKEEYEEATGK